MNEKRIQVEQITNGIVGYPHQLVLTLTPQAATVMVDETSKTLVEYYNSIDDEGKQYIIDLMESRMVQYQDAVKHFNQFQTMFYAREHFVLFFWKVVYDSLKKHIE